MKIFHFVATVKKRHRSDQPLLSHQELSSASTSQPSVVRPYPRSESPPIVLNRTPSPTGFLSSPLTISGNNSSPVPGGSSPGPGGSSPLMGGSSPLAGSSPQPRSSPLSFITSSQATAETPGDGSAPQTPIKETDVDSLLTADISPARVSIKLNNNWHNHIHVIITPSPIYCVYSNNDHTDSRSERQYAGYLSTYIFF